MALVQLRKGVITGTAVKALGGFFEGAASFL
ncbi:MAG: hypothetical protein CM1200mP1_00560 [Candidatus Neomarinimicrobiota bacterium]|nr:MAG: hypothetical protein CM1200mP1_00560 [Candidatus Neomarinimicrobiota bacterium]